MRVRVRVRVHMRTCAHVYMGGFHTNLVHGGSLGIPLLSSVPSMERPQQTEADLAVPVEVGVEAEACEEDSTGVWVVWGEGM